MQLTEARFNIVLCMALITCSAFYLTNYKFHHALHIKMEENDILIILYIPKWTINANSNVKRIHLLSSLQ
jgi:hypothetical protein